MNFLLNNIDYVCPTPCGECCNILTELNARGGYPTSNKTLNKFYEEFFEHLEKSGVKPLFDWKKSFILKKTKCPYSGKNSCLITDRNKRHELCRTSTCNKSKVEK